MIVGVNRRSRALAGLLLSPLLAGGLLAACGAAPVTPRGARVFRAAGAGRWFPASESELREKVDGYLMTMIAPRGEDVLALISPHAGYAYSGRIAGQAFTAVKGKRYDAVIILGFAHRPTFRGVAVLDADAYATPLGTVPVDAALAALLLREEGLCAAATAPFVGEHSAENQIPFVQRALPGTPILPLLAGEVDAAGLRRLTGALARILAERNVLLVASTDLSHYHPLARAVEMDSRVIGRVRRLDAEGLAEMQARGLCEFCGVVPTLAALAAAKEAGASEGILLGRGTSADAPGGSAERVVGYLAAALVGTRRGAAAESAAERSGAMAQHDAEADGLTDEEKRVLLAIARQTVEAVADGKAPPPLPPAAGRLAERRNAFVSLHARGELRGCIGTFEADGPLTETVREMAVSSALRDRRFRPVAPAELPDIEIEISVLTVPRPVRGPGDVVLGRDGIIVRQGGRQGTYLPQVAAQTGWSVEEFLSHCAADKAGLAPDAWRRGAEILTYRAEVFSEGELGLR